MLDNTVSLSVAQVNREDNASYHRFRGVDLLMIIETAERENFYSIKFGV